MEQKRQLQLFSIELFKTKGFNKIPLDYESFIKVFDHLSSLPSEKARIKSNETNNYSVIYVEKPKNDKIQGIMTHARKDQIPGKIEETEKYPKEAIQLKENMALGEQTFFYIFYVGKDTTGTDKFVLAVLANLHGPRASKIEDFILELAGVKTDFNISEANLIALAKSDPFAKLNDNQTIYELDLSYKPQITKYAEELDESIFSAGKLLSKLDPIDIVINVRSAGRIRKDSQPLKNLMVKSVKKFLQKVIEGGDRSHVNKLKIKTKNELGGIEFIDIISEYISYPVSIYREEEWYNSETIFSKIKSIIDTNLPEIKRYFDLIT